METATLGKISMEVDAALTRQIYSSIECGETKRCGCAYCRNYMAQLPGIFPKEVLAFFEICGIDVNKDADVGQVGEIRPGTYCYLGEYFFICKTPPLIDNDNLPNDFTFAITLPSPVTQEKFVNVPGARSFSFSCEVPWVLNEHPSLKKLPLSS